MSNIDKLIAVKTNADGTLDDEGRQALTKELQGILDSEPSIPKDEHERLIAKVLGAANAGGGGVRLMSEVMEIGDGLRSLAKLLSPHRKAVVHIGRTLSEAGRSRSAFEVGAAYGLLLAAGSLMEQSVDTMRHALTCDCGDDDAPSAKEPTDAPKAEQEASA